MTKDCSGFSLLVILQLFEHLNGVLFPGGDVSVFNSDFSKVAKIFFDLALEAHAAGEVFPIWGTCQGFEQLAVLTADFHNVLTNCNAHGMNLPLNLTTNWRSSRLYGQAPDHVIKQLTTKPITMNFHTECFTMDSFTRHRLGRFWNVLSVNNDVNGLQFISTLEAKEAPIFGTQFHPEKNPYVWLNPRIPDVAHSRDGIDIAYYMASFFVDLARRSNHSFPDRDAVESALIYNYRPFYSGKVWSMFDQIYLF
jgi:gamma-glutamyl hydrolase